MDRFELAWAAGFFDGEGCIRLARGYPNLHLGQTDRRPLDRFRAAVGGGNVTGPYDKRNSRPMFQWTCYTREEVERIVNLLWPYLSEPKRESIGERLWIDA